MERIENKTFQELAVGDSECLTRIVNRQDIELLAIASGDPGLVQAEDTLTPAGSRVAILVDVTWVASLFAALVGSKLPGPGSVVVDQALHVHGSIGLEDTITAKVTVAAKTPETGRVALTLSAVNQRGEEVVSGDAVVLAPATKIYRNRGALPYVKIRTRGRSYERLIALTHGIEPIRTAVVHPVDKPSLLGAVEAARSNLIVPILVGPEAKIRSTAEESGLDISGFQIVSAEHSTAATAQAVAMARGGQVEAIMKGALHTDELMHAVVDPERGLTTTRRISHVFAIDAPDYPRPLFITDAAINIAPTLTIKRDIVQNAIDLAHAVGIQLPRVAILAAVETVTEKLRSTTDAAALCKMADRGQITGGILDGPLAFDNAVSSEAARTKGIVSPVAGRADIFVVPDIDAGNMLAKQLEYLADAQMAGIVLGAQVPIILTSRADDTIARLGSSAIALLLVRGNASSPRAE